MFEEKPESCGDNQGTNEDDPGKAELGFNKTENNGCQPFMLGDRLTGFGMGEYIHQWNFSKIEDILSQIKMKRKITIGIDHMPAARQHQEKCGQPEEVPKCREKK